MDITQLIIRHLPTKKKSNASGGWYICCSMCTSRGESRNDTKFRGGLTPRSDGGIIYHCHNCGFATKWEVGGHVSKNLMNFMVTLGIDSKQIPIALRLLPANQKLETVIDIDVPEVAIDFEEVKLPRQAHTFDYWAEDDEIPGMFLEGFEYLASRGEAVFNGWNYYWSNDTKFSMNQRIIIPFYHNRKVVGYTARKFTDSEKLSKYYGETPADYLFNQDILETEIDRVLLVEGVLDAIAIKGIACLGNSLTQKQINLLNTCRKNVILVPDRNKAGTTLLEQALDNGWEVSVPDWDSGISDCAEATKRYGTLYTLESIFSSATTNKLRIMNTFGVSRL